MGYIGFLFFLAQSAIAFAILRLFTSKFSFERVATAVGLGFVFLPVVIWSFIICFVIVFGVALVVTGILDAAGVLPIVAGLSFWQWMPMWAWAAVATGLAFSTSMYLAWRK